MTASHVATSFFGFAANLVYFVAICAYLAAQLRPRGQAFLETDKGAAATVAMGVFGVAMSAPSALGGSLVSMALVALWSWVAYASHEQAISGFKSILLPGRR